MAIVTKSFRYFPQSSQLNAYILQPFQFIIIILWADMPD
jgi:hypothetical protein